jgi:hypothetical protein
MGGSKKRAGWLTLVVTACSSWGCADNDADVRVASVTRLGPMPVPAGIVGRDGGVSGRFQGRSVWVYGDSVVTEAGTYPSTWRNNTMSWTEDLDASDGVSELQQPRDVAGAPREFFPRTVEEEAFNAAHLDHGHGTCDAEDDSPCGARFAIWGSGPVEDLERGRALLTYGKVYAEPGEFNFTILGTSLAIWRRFEAEPERPLIDGALGDARLLFSASEGEFAVPILHAQYLYLFSCSGQGAAANGCRLARAALDQVFERSAWKFRGKHDWVDTADDADRLFDGSPNMTVVYNAHLGRFLASYISWGRIVLRSAPQLEGPWSDEVTLYEPPEENAIHAQLHPEFAEGGGATEYMSYLAENRFQLLRVALSR